MRYLAVVGKSKIEKRLNSCFCHKDVNAKKTNVKKTIFYEQIQTPVQQKIFVTNIMTNYNQIFTVGDLFYRVCDNDQYDVLHCNQF